MMTVSPARAKQKPPIMSGWLQRTPMSTTSNRTSFAIASRELRVRHGGFHHALALDDDGESDPSADLRLLSSAITVVGARPEVAPERGWRGS